MSRIAFLFPGQGSQYVGMGRELCRAFPEAAAVFREADECLGFDLAGLCWNGPEASLTLTEQAQPAILTGSLAAAAVLGTFGITPDLVAGHSLGEYSAIVAAGGLSLAEGVRLVRLRGQLMSRALPAGEGGMAAVLGLSADVVEEVCRLSGGLVQVANRNCPGQVVISGRAADVERAGRLAVERGARRVIPLAVSGPFHSALMKPAAEEFGRHLGASGLCDLKVPLVANVDASVHQKAEELLPLMIRQVSSPVLWEESMRLLAGQGVTTAIEVGPKNVLAGLMKRIEPGVRVFTTDQPGDFDAVRKHLDAGERRHG